MKKIKIAFVLSTLTGGGAERVTLNIINSLDKDKFDVHLILLQNYGEYLKQVPSDIQLTILNAKKTLLSFFKLHKFLKILNADVVYATLFHTNIALYISTIGLKRKPKIVLRNPTSPKRILEEKQISKLHVILLKWVYNNVDLVVAQTPEMKDEIKQYFHVVKTPVQFFMNPLNEKQINQSIENAIDPFDSTKINIVAAGRLSYEKGFDILLEAFSKIIQENSNYFLHIIGKDEGEYENLIKDVKRLDLEENVKFWGFQQNPYAFFLYSELYVLSSRIEGLPNTVLENLYLNKPVITTNCIPFMSTLIQDGKNGFIVDIENSKQLAHAILNYKKLKNIDKFHHELGNPNSLFLQLFSKS